MGCLAFANTVRRERNYPQISVNSRVRINITPKHVITKGHDPKWSSENIK